MMMETFERTEGEEVIGSLGDQLVEANATSRRYVELFSTYPRNCRSH